MSISAGLIDSAYHVRCIYLCTDYVDSSISLTLSSEASIFLVKQTRIDNVVTGSIDGKVCAIGLESERVLTFIDEYVIGCWLL